MVLRVFEVLRRFLESWGPEKTVGLKWKAVGVL